MRKRIQLSTSSERRRIRDIVQKADQLRRDQVFFEPGGSYSGGGGNASNYGGYLPDNFYGHNDPPCVRVPTEAQMLAANGDGTFAIPDGFELTEAYYDGVNATGHYDVVGGNVVPHTALDPSVEISGLMYPR